MPLLQQVSEIVLDNFERANYLKVAESDIMQMIQDGSLKAKKIGSQYRISKSTLDDFLRS